jgi:enamine deaminase RidA (YjgF/YER057c/UK114 family)
VPIGGDRALLYVAGQVSIEEAQARARVCALNVLAQIESTAGLENVEQLSQVVGFVLCADGFGDQPKVLNGASDLFVEVLGEAGRHTRIALGANALPFSVTVEIAAVAFVRTR